MQCKWAVGVVVRGTSVTHRPRRVTDSATGQSGSRCCVSAGGASVCRPGWANRGGGDDGSHVRGRSDGAGSRAACWPAVPAAGVRRCRRERRCGRLLGRVLAVRRRPAGLAGPAADVDGTAAARRAPAGPGGATRRRGPAWVPAAVRARSRGARHRAAVEPPGAGRRAGARGPGRRGGHRHGVGQVAGLPAAGAGGVRRRPAGHRALPVADQGAGRRPAAGGHRARAAGRAGDPLRRRHPARRARLGAPARAGGCSATRTCCTASVLPRHEPLGALPAAAALRGARRVPHLPGAVRVARRAAAAAAAAGLRAVRRRADARARLGDGRRPGRVRVPADRARGRGGRRRRLAVRGAHRGAVGAAAAGRAVGRERGTGAPVGGRGVGADARRPGDRGRPDAGVRAVPAGRRADGARARSGCSPRSARSWSRGCRPTAAATCPRSGARWRRRWSTARCSAWRRRTRWSSAWTSRASTPWSSPGSPARGRRSGSRPAGRARPGRGAGRAGGAGRPARHLPRAPSGRPARARRWRGACSTRATRTCSPRIWPVRPPSCR